MTSILIWKDHLFTSKTFTFSMLTLSWIFSQGRLLTVTLEGLLITYAFTNTLELHIWMKYHFCCILNFNWDLLSLCYMFENWLQHPQSSEWGKICVYALFNQSLGLRNLAFLLVYKPVLWSWVEKPSYNKMLQPPFCCSARIQWDGATENS